jgi:hypothetical protein
MALIINFESAHGLEGPLYWRLNNFDQLGNREPDGSRIPTIARFRAYASEEAFRSGKNFLEELLVSFQSSSVNADMAAEAYAAFKEHDPSETTAANVAGVTEALAAADAEVTAAERKLKQALKPPQQATAKEELENAKLIRDTMEGELERAKGAHKAAVSRRAAVAKAKPA